LLLVEISFLTTLCVYVVPSSAARLRSTTTPNPFTTEDYLSLDRFRHYLDERSSSYSSQHEEEVYRAGGYAAMSGLNYGLGFGAGWVPQHFHDLQSKEAFDQLALHFINFLEQMPKLWGAAPSYEESYKVTMPLRLKPGRLHPDVEQQQQVMAEKLRALKTRGVGLGPANWKEEQGYSPRLKSRGEEAVAVSQSQSQRWLPTNQNGCSYPFGYPTPVRACLPAFSCNISQLLCQNVLYDVSQVNDTSNCTVVEVNCTDGPTPFLQRSFCKPLKYKCGTVVDAPQDHLLACPIAQLLCDDDTVVDFNPNPEANCNNTAYPHCQDACMGEGDGCICSLDRIGVQCQDWRPYTCQFLLVEPSPECRLNDQVDSDPVCFLHRRADVVRFEYRVNCTFNKQPTNYTEDPRFEYFVRNNEFAVSKAQRALWALALQLKVYDFNFLSNRNATQVVELDAAQMGGETGVAFTLNYTAIPDRFFAGDRLYFEVGLTKESHIEGRRLKYDRRFIDFSDLHISRHYSSSLTYAQISYIVAGVLGGILILVLVGYYIHRRIVRWRQQPTTNYLD
jgi:hypothetical protein